MLPTNVFALNNRRAVIAVGALGGIGGSVLTFLLCAFTLLSARQLMGQRYPAQWIKTDWIILVPSTVFAVVQAGFALQNASWADLETPRFWSLTGPLLIYFSGWLVIPRLRAGIFDSLGALALGAGFCCMLAIPVSIIQIMYWGIRAEGGGGNALPFALICTVFGAISLLNIRIDSIFRKSLGLVGFASAVCCILMSGTLSLLPVLMLWLLVFALANRKLFRFVSKIRVLYVLGGLAVLFAYPSLLWLRRFFFLIEFLKDPVNAGAHLPQFTERLAMWSSALTLYLDRPWLGHGLQNRSQLINLTTDLFHSHFHNGFLTVMVDSGNIGLIAALLMVMSPFILGYQSPRDHQRFERVFLGAVISFTYVFSGLTNIVFMHDIYDSVFLWTSLCLAVSMPLPTNITNQSGQAQS